MEITKVTEAEAHKYLENLPAWKQTLMNRLGFLKLPLSFFAELFQYELAVILLITMLARRLQTDIIKKARDETKENFIILASTFQAILNCAETYGEVRVVGGARVTYKDYDLPACLEGMFYHPKCVIFDMDGAPNIRVPGPQTTAALPGSVKQILGAIAKNGNTKDAFCSEGSGSKYFRLDDAWYDAPAVFNAPGLIVYQGDDFYGDADIHDVVKFTKAIPINEDAIDLGMYAWPTTDIRGLNQAIAKLS